jgi:hypothetical protein
MANSEHPSPGDVIIATDDPSHSVSIYPQRAELHFDIVERAYGIARKLALERKSRLWYLHGSELFQLSRVEMVARDPDLEPVRPATKRLDGPVARPSSGY